MCGYPTKWVTAASEKALRDNSTPLARRLGPLHWGACSPVSAPPAYKPAHLHHLLPERRLTGKVLLSAVDNGVGWPGANIVTKLRLRATMKMDSLQAPQTPFHLDQFGWRLMFFMEINILPH